MTSLYLGTGLVGKLGIFYVWAGWAGFSWQWKHVLSALLCMEVSLIGVLLTFLGGGSVAVNHLFFMVLSLGVCESALGLALVVIYVRRFGNDMFSSLDGQGY